MRPRNGFTLIEVIGASAAFIIAFLAGTAAFTKLLHYEMANYHRVLAGIAAVRMLKPTATVGSTMTDMSPHMLWTRADPVISGNTQFWYGDNVAQDVNTSIFVGSYHP